jgi:hypothetical protein
MQDNMNAPLILSWAPNVVIVLINRELAPDSFGHQLGCSFAILRPQTAGCPSPRAGRDCHDDQEVI